MTVRRKRLEKKLTDITTGFVGHVEGCDQHIGSCTPGAAEDAVRAQSDARGGAGEVQLIWLRGDNTY